MNQDCANCAWRDDCGRGVPCRDYIPYTQLLGREALPFSLRDDGAEDIRRYVGRRAEPDERNEARWY